MNDRGSEDKQFEGRKGGTGANAKSNKGDELLKRGVDQHRANVRSAHGGHPFTTGKGNKA